MIEITDFFPMEKWEEFCSFFTECYRPNHSLCDRKFFEWQFMVKPGDDKANIICGWDNGKLLGIHAYIPLLVHWGGFKKSIQALWTLCWVVRKQAPKGLGLLITKKIQDMSPLILSANASKTGVSFFKVLGWSVFPRIPRYICVLNKKEECVHMLSEGAGEEDLDAFIFKPQANGSLRISEYNFNNDNYYPQWHLYPGLSFGTMRSLDYINWRYVEHPIFRYHIILEGASNRPAVCVYRIERTSGLYEARVGRIVDFFFPNDEQGHGDGLNLMDAVLKHMKSIGCAYVDFISSNKEYSEVFVSLGGCEESESRQILPVRLNPIERVLRHQNLVVFTGKDFSLPRLEDMYITKSDIDADGPAKSPYYEGIQKDYCYELRS